jgi:protein-disulfide isomerase
MKLEQHSPKLANPINERDHAQGPADAPVTLLEYGDYECPYCGQAYPVVKEIQKRMGNRLRFVFRNFPLNTIHEHAGVAAGCRGRAQGKFWEMRHLYEHQADSVDSQVCVENRPEIYHFNADLGGKYAKK